MFKHVLQFRGMVVGLVILALLAACENSAPTDIVHEAVQPQPTNEVHELKTRLGLRTPTGDASYREVRVTIYNRQGEVTRAFDLPRSVARTVWAELKTAARSTSQSGQSLPAPAASFDGAPLAAVFVDTTVTFEVDAVEYTLESAATSTQLLAATTYGVSIPFRANWFSYDGSGDSVIVSSATIQVYDGGYLALETYFSSGAIADLNDDLNNPELGPFPSEGSCFAATMTLTGASGAAAAATALFLKAPTFVPTS